MRGLCDPCWPQPDQPEPRAGPSRREGEGKEVRMLLGMGRAWSKPDLIPVSPAALSSQASSWTPGPLVPMRTVITCAFSWCSLGFQEDKGV